MKTFLTTLVLCMALAVQPAFGQKKGKGWSRYGYAGSANTEQKDTKADKVQVKEQQPKVKPAKQPKAKQEKLTKRDMPTAARDRLLETAWFVGAQLAPNVAVADNITDHPFFDHLGHALGLGFEVYGGKFFTPNVGMRVAFGYSNGKNRGDHEVVDNPKPIPALSYHRYDDLFEGHGFYHFSVVDLHADALFDFAGRRSRTLHRPLHLLGLVGVGAIITGEAKVKAKPEATEADKAWVIKTLAKNKKSNTTPALRLGLIFDYHITEQFSVNLEGNLSVTTDKFDGIDYDEPVDFLLKAKIGATYRF